MSESTGSSSQVPPLVGRLSAFSLVEPIDYTEIQHSRWWGAASQSLFPPYYWQAFSNIHDLSLRGRLELGNFTEFSSEIRRKVII